MAFPSDKIKGVTFEEGLNNLVQRDPILADSAEELRQRYSEEQVFGGVFLPAFQSIVGEVRDKIADGLEEGLSPSEIEQKVKEKIPDLSSAYTEVVFRTNVNTAYTDGRIAQAQKFTGFIVGFEFSPVGDENTRPEHEILRGLRADQEDRIWRLVKSPLDYNCRCMLIQITRPEITDEEAYGEDGLLRRYHPKLGYDFSEGSLLDMVRSADDKGKLPNFIKDRM